MICIISDVVYEYKIHTHVHHGLVTTQPVVIGVQHSSLSTIIFDSRNTCTTKINFTRLHKKRTLVWEGSIYSRNGTPMGVSSTSAFSHEMHNTVYNEVKLNSKGEI